MSFLSTGSASGYEEIIDRIKVVQLGINQRVELDFIYPVGNTALEMDMFVRARSLAGYPNQSYIGASNLNTIREDNKIMDPKKAMEIIELSEYAEEAIAEAMREFEAGLCKNFSTIDELFEDLDSD